MPAEDTELTSEQRRNYQPSLCRSCDSPVRVVGWDDVSTLENTGNAWLPRRKCTKEDCKTNGGGIADPRP